MAILPKVKLKALPVFPTQVLAGPFISITKTAGVFTFSFDPSAMQQVAEIPIAKRNQTYLMAWDPVDDVFYLVQYGSSAAGQPYEEHLITATGDVTISDAETADVIGITNTSGSPINVFLPAAGNRTKMITIADKGANTNTNNFTVKPKLASGQTIMGGTQFVMDSNGMSIGLMPWADGTGYH